MPIRVFTGRAFSSIAKRRRPNVTRPSRKGCFRRSAPRRISLLECPALTDSFDSGSLYMGQGIIRTTKRLSLYYSGSPLKHNEAELPNLTRPGNQRIYSRVAVPLDRFVAVAAGPDGGGFATPLLLYKGDLLTLNAEVREGGSVRVGLLDDRNEPIPGRSLEDCLLIEGDRLAATVKWKDGSGVSTREAVPTRLAFRLKNASLYTFRFTTPGNETD